MGLCPDCKEEGETVSYIGASKADIVDDIEPGNDSGDVDCEDDDQDTKICDLCEEEYVVDGESEQ
jgi:hypothetical protein